MSESGDRDRACDLAGHRLSFWCLMGQVCLSPPIKGLLTLLNQWELLSVPHSMRLPSSCMSVPRSSRAKSPSRRTPLTQGSVLQDVNLRPSLRCNGPFERVRAGQAGGQPGHSFLTGFHQMADDRVDLEARKHPEKRPARNGSL